MKINLKPLTCEGARELMFDYIDGELKESAVQRLEAHIGECSACRRELNERSAMLELIGRCSEAPPALLKRGVMERIENIPQEKRQRLGMRRFAPLGALGAAAAAVMVLIVSRGMISSGAADDAVAGEMELRISAGVYGSPKVEVGLADAQAANDELEYDSDADDVVYMTKSSFQTEDIEYTATTTALVATSPALEIADADKTAENRLITDIQTSSSSAMTDMAAGASEISAIDTMFNTLTVGDNAVLVCYESDLQLITSDSMLEVVISDNNEYIRYVITNGAMKLFTESLEALEASDSEYRASIPEGDFTECEILMIADSEGEQ